RRADQMKVPRMPVRGLVPGSAFAEVDFARDSRADHPLERSIHRGAADSGRFAMDQLHELVRAHMAFLPQEHTEDAIPFDGAFTAGRDRESWRLSDLVNW